jgi:fructosamine-3-kinase
MESRREEWQKKMAERRGNRMAKLKSDLGITAAQEGAWTQFTDATKPPAAPAQPDMARGDWEKLTTPERIDRMEQRMNERQQRFKQMGDATKALYTQLSPAQQKVFDERWMRGGGGGGMRGRKDGGDHRHGD